MQMPGVGWEPSLVNVRRSPNSDVQTASFLEVSVTVPVSNGLLKPGGGLPLPSLKSPEIAQSDPSNLTKNSPQWVYTLTWYGTPISG